MANTIDNFTLGHLGRWIEHNVRPEAIMAVAEAMSVEFENDPEYWGSRGWTDLFKQVDGYSIERRIEEAL